MSAAEFTQYRALFTSLAGGRPITREQADSVFAKAALPREEFDLIWALTDKDMDGILSGNEFAIALHLAAHRCKGGALPEHAPSDVLPLDADEEEDDEEDHDFNGGRRKTKGFGRSSSFGLGRRSRRASNQAPPPPPQQQQQMQMQMQPPPGYGGGGVARSGLLKVDKRAKWCVLEGGTFSVYSDPGAAQVGKPAKMQLSIRNDVARVACTNLNSFALHLNSQGRNSGAPPRLRRSASFAPKKSGANDIFTFSSDEPQEVLGWVNDINAVFKAVH